jgi:hypothetical protein
VEKPVADVKQTTQAEKRSAKADRKKMTSRILRNPGGSTQHAAYP